MKITIEWSGEDETLVDAINMLRGALALTADDDDLLEEASDLGGVSTGDLEPVLALSQMLVTQLAGGDFPCDEGEEDGGRLTVRIEHGEGA